MPYSPLAVANYFLEKSKSEGKATSQMKLQKLVYFAHGWHLALYDQPLINEGVEAWTYGPVIYSLYKEFKSCGNEPIDHLAGEPKPPQINFNNHELKTFLDKVWDTYSNLSAFQLSNLTHESDSPWKNPTIIRETISDEEIKKYFKAQLDQ